MRQATQSRPELCVADHALETQRAQLLERQQKVPLKVALTVRDVERQQLWCEARNGLETSTRNVGRCEVQVRQRRSDGVQLWHQSIKELRLSHGRHATNATIARSTTVRCQDGRWYADAEIDRIKVTQSERVEIVSLACSDQKAERRREEIGRQVAWYHEHDTIRW